MKGRNDIQVVRKFLEGRGRLVINPVRLVCRNENRGFHRDLTDVMSNCKG